MRNATGQRHDIVRMIRHELNTPLATALLYIGIAEGSAAGLPEGIVKSALRVARSEVQRLKTLIDTLTELECAGHATLRPRSFDVGDTVRSTVKRVVALRDPGQVRVVTLGDLRGWWDRPKIEQIVGNLLSNALKFGLGRPVRVEVKPVREGVTITVRDQGIGITPADQGWIFERHAHAPAEQGGGLGLGLWLVRELAAAHGGWVTLESRRGRGAAFTVFLRGRRPPTKHGGLATGAARPAAAGAGLTVAPAPSPTAISPPFPETLKPSKPSKTRKSIEELTL
ncbi:MAG TPA: HAMP domain-containing sensor histidine kinase [Polyangia bacterium]|nr:HAMP domain-containing sensor histidine kinase [Polyangia bacterium]